ncbi:MAG TPA: helix-hairpin-helix domain-containing protein [Nitrospira sp.]|jgi:competence protein ComEA|nr:helix-hairpin-helix domain-containing protein [Nitrospira sp.]
MIKSLLLKLGLLAVTIAVVFWVRWTPHPSVQDAPPATEKQLVASRTTESEKRENRSAGSSSRNVSSPNIKTDTETAPSQTAVHSRLDLNRASAGELESLPGIGAVLAQRVIVFRESVGRFHKIEDLREVKGIGAKKFERLKSFVMVSAANSKQTTEHREL